MTDAPEQGHINEGPAPFRREDRYIVVKRKDLREVPELARYALHVALEGVREHLPHRECLVVESDWPEHDVVWAAIEERMRLVDGRVPDPLLTRSYEEAFYALASALGFSGARACSPQTVMHDLMLPRIQHLQDCAAAHREFSDKTDWVQTPSTPARFLGMHRADIARTMLRDAEAERDRLRAQLDEAKGLLWSTIDPVDRPLQRMRIREFLGPRTTGVEATPRTTGVDVVPGGATTEPLRLRHAIAYAVHAQTGASRAVADVRAHAALCLLSLDDDTVVVGAL